MIKNGQIKLADFGFAVKTSRDLDQTMKSELLTNAGTPKYQAPEIQEEDVYDSKVDVFSCGVLFFELLCTKRLKKPFTRGLIMKLSYGKT